MAFSNTFDTTNQGSAVSNREDLTDVLTILAPEETPILSSANKERASATNVEWTVDSLSAPQTTGISEGADVTILMLTDAEAVEEVVFGVEGNSEGLANNLRPGSLLIDMGTTSVLKTRAFATKLEMSGSEWVDAPVS